MQLLNRVVTGQAHRKSSSRHLRQPRAATSQEWLWSGGGQGWGMKRTEFELPDRRPRNGRCSLFGGGYTHPDSLCRNRSSVTDLVTDLVTAGRMNFVVEVFSCEATEVAKQVAVACGFVTKP